MQGVFSWCRKLLGLRDSADEPLDGACRLCYMESLAAGGSTSVRCLRHRQARFEQPQSNA